MRRTGGCKVPDKKIDIYQQAVEIEERGREFYERAAAKTENPLGREIFQALLESEREHIQRIENICKALKEGRAIEREIVECPIDVDEVKRLFESIYEQHREIIASTTDDADAVKVGMELEKAAIEFYRKKLGEVGDPLEREFIEQMIIEEELHYKALAELHAYFTDPKGWLEEKQGFKMDSG